MLLLEPGARVPVYLPRDAHLPEYSRPTFYARVLTARETITLERLERDVQGHLASRPGLLWRALWTGLQVLLACCVWSGRGKTELDLRTKHLVRLLAYVLVDWRHVTTGPFEAKRLPDLLTAREMLTLYQEAIKALTLAEDDEKKSPLPSACSPAASAAPVQKVVPSIAPAAVLAGTGCA